MCVNLNSKVRKKKQKEGRGRKKSATAASGVISSKLRTGVKLNNYETLLDEIVVEIHD